MICIPVSGEVEQKVCTIVHVLKERKIETTMKIIL